MYIYTLPHFIKAAAPPAGGKAIKLASQGGGLAGSPGRLAG